MYVHCTLHIYVIHFKFLLFISSTFMCVYITFYNSIVEYKLEFAYYRKKRWCDLRKKSIKYIFEKTF